MVEDVEDFVGLSFSLFIGVSEQVTAHQLAKQKEVDQKSQEQERKEKAAVAKRSVTEDSYAALVDVTHDNRVDDAVDARSLNAAISALGITASPGADAEDRHPERCGFVVKLLFSQDGPGICCK